jgi:hypothetical protein
MEVLMSRTPSPAEVMAAKGANGYWPKEKLAEWGIPTDPVPARWREGLERRWHEEHIPEEVRELLDAAGYDEQGIETAWRSVYYGVGRMRMFEEYWKDPDNVLTQLRAEIVEVRLTHPGGGEITMRLPVTSELAERAIAALEAVGWRVL